MCVWLSHCCFIVSSYLQEKLEKARKEGWEYARFHNQTYHSSEHKMDLARRRRWLRKMTAKDTTKPAIFYFKSKPKGAKRMMTSLSSGLSSLKSIGKKKDKVGCYRLQISEVPNSFFCLN